MGNSSTAGQGAAKRQSKPVSSSTPLTAQDFQLAITAQVAGAAKTRKSLAAAIVRLEKAKARLLYMKALADFAEGIGREILQPVEAQFDAVVEKEIRLLDGWYDRCPHKLTPSLRRLLREVVVWRLEEAISSRGLHQLQPLLDRHSPPPSEAERKEAVESACDFFESITGVKIDPNDVDPDLSPEAAARLGEKYGEQFRNSGGFRGRPPRKKTKKQLAAEESRKQAAELLDRDLNRLFKDLAMKLHPDREQDPVLRLEKEELMKVLIRARDESDYSELLRLHVQVLGSDSASDRQLFGESTVKTLTNLLNEKTAVISNQVLSLRFAHPLLRPGLRITEVQFADHQTIRQAAGIQANGLKQVVLGIEKNLALFQRDAQSFIRYLKSRPHEVDEDDDDDWVDGAW